MMNIHKIEWDKFYQKLGHLYYAIAKCDKTITPEEMVELKNIARTEWTIGNGASVNYKSDDTYQIENIFHLLAKSNSSTEYAFKIFSDFVNENKELLTPDLKQKIMQTADKIASAKSGKNKAELTLLFQLHQLIR